MNFGELIFISRKDHQIKHLGHRIELAEIEVAAGTIEGMMMNCTVFDNDKKRIFMYCVAEIEMKEILLKLKKLLPRYMIPYEIIMLEKMPLTSNGKLDRKGLLEEAKKR